VPNAWAFVQLTDLLLGACVEPFFESHVCILFTSVSNGFLLFAASSLKVVEAMARQSCVHAIAILRHPLPLYLTSVL